MSLDAPLPWESETPGRVEMWSDEDEARTWAEAEKSMGVR